MKILLLFALIVTFTMVRRNTAAQKAVEPEYLSVFFFLEDSGILKPLERQTPESKIKVKGLGFGGGEGYLQIVGEQSPVRFKSNTKFEFVVLVASQQTDPMSFIQLFSFEKTKGIRRLMMAKVGSMGMSSKNVTNQNAVSFNAAKYGTSSFKISPASELKPGEYCLITANSMTAFCFGVASIST
ncbi:MAG: hypothetical protein IPO41_13150 [Acidobacteria bacterium]|nr:hypothetical protein [Acidobacteriota bacterium]